MPSSLIAMEAANDRYLAVIKTEEDGEGILNPG